MDELMKTLLIFVLGGSVSVVVVVIFIFMHPEKIEKWISLIFKAGLFILKNATKLKKNYVKFDLQGRVNSFTKRISTNVPSLGEYKLSLEWVQTEEIDRKSFLDGNNVILRIKKDDPSDENFVHGAFTFVSHCMLMSVKRHINESQKISIDTFVTAELIKTEKPQVFNFFAEKYLHTCINNKNKEKYFNNYQTINEHGYFFEVLLQEMDYLGQLVVTKASKLLLKQEYDQIVDFLLKTSNRYVGDDNTDLYYSGQYSKMLIIIIGKSKKVNDHNLYLKYLRNETAKQQIDTIYAFGAKKNKDAIEKVFNDFNPDYQIFHSGISDAMLNFKDGTKQKVKQYFCILRNVNRQLSM